MKHVSVLGKEKVSFQSFLGRPFLSSSVLRAIKKEGLLIFTKRGIEGTRYVSRNGKYHNTQTAVPFVITSVVSIRTPKEGSGDSSQLLCVNTYGTTKF